MRNLDSPSAAAAEAFVLRRFGTARVGLETAQRGSIGVVLQHAPEQATR
jgi:hypothetical protein